MCGEINGEKLLYIKEEEMKIVNLDCLSKKKFVKVARLYLVIERWKMKMKDEDGVIECGRHHSQ